MNFPYIFSLPDVTTSHLPFSYVYCSVHIVDGQSRFYVGATNGKNDNYHRRNYAFKHFGMPISVYVLYIYPEGTYKKNDPDGKETEFTCWFQDNGYNLLNKTWHSARPCGPSKEQLQESIQRSMATHLERYGKLCGHLHTPEAEAKARATLITRYGGVWARAMTPEAQARKVATQRSNGTIERMVHASHTPEACAKRASTNASRYGNPAGYTNSPELVEARKKAIVGIDLIDFHLVHYTHCKACPSGAIPKACNGTYYKKGNHVYKGYYWVFVEDFSEDLLDAVKQKYA